MTAIREGHGSTSTVGLYVAFDLGWGQWKLAFTIGHGQSPRLRSVVARDLRTLKIELAKAKKRFGLPEDAPVFSCYEAGRDGFWLHRYLAQLGVISVVVDSSSIEVNRRQRRAKSDRLDATKLVTMLLRYHAGEKKVWSVVTVPGVDDEDHRQLHRELEELKDEQTQHVNRIKGLLASQGACLGTVTPAFPEDLPAIRSCDGSSVPAELQKRLVREHLRWQLVHKQILELETERRHRIRTDSTPHVDQVRTLLNLTGIGVNGAWMLVMELFAWRKPRNRKQLGALVGLTPTPYQSGSSAREQGITKAGNRRLRRLLVELAWCWLRFQPDSALSQWYRQRFAGNGKRSRKVGIVALARKLLIALWRLLETGEVPEGAKCGAWDHKVTRVTKAA